MTVNGAAVRKSGQLVAGDVVAVVIPASTASAGGDHGLTLPLLHEDDVLAAIDKPAGLAVHGAPGDAGPSVAGWWRARLGAAAGGFGVEHPGIVHRLDKDTSGVLLLAKTPDAQAKLSSAFENRSAKKTYLAICDGVPPQERAIVDAPLARHPGDRTRMAVTTHGRASRTGFDVLFAARGRAFLVVRPETGRTHQIRVHLAAIGAPVRFDRVYGTPGEGRQLLHAWQLEVPHPDGDVLLVTAALPADFLAALEDLGVPNEVTAPFALPAGAMHRRAGEETTLQNEAG